MPPDILSLATARNSMLAAQGLAIPAHRLAEKSDVLAAIRPWLPNTARHGTPELVIRRSDPPELMQWLRG